MLTVLRKSAFVLAALAAFGLGGAALAGAADNGPSGSSTTTDMRPAREALSSDVASRVRAAALAEVPGATVIRAEAGGPYDSAYHAHIRTSDGTLQVVLVNSAFEATAVEAERSRGPGGRGGAGGGETPLAGETKTKVEAAVLAKYPGSTMLRTETNSDSTVPYESHIRTAAGAELEVLVSAGFEVVDAREHPARS